MAFTHKIVKNKEYILKVLIFGSREFEQVSQRGISIITSTFTDLGWDVTFITYPYHIWHLLDKKKRNLCLKGKKVYTQQGNLLKNFSVIITIPYYKRMPYLIRKYFINLFKISHSYFLPQIDYAKYDIVIIESGKAVFLVDKINSPKIIYRQSDPVISQFDEYVEKYEQKLIEKANLTLVVSNSIYQEYKKRKPELTANMEIWENGINIDENNKKINPYSAFPNALYVGLSSIDWECIFELCKEVPNLHVHIIGPHKVKRDNYPRNLHLYGYIPHSRAMAYIKYAQICLLPYREKNKMECTKPVLTSKIKLYMYYKKPIVARPTNIEEGKMFNFYGLKVVNTPRDFVSKIKEIVKNEDFKCYYKLNLKKYEIKERINELKNILKKYNFI